MSNNSKLCYERDHYDSNKIIAGFDEVGRGAIAGPIVVACVILKPNFSHRLIKDSKQLTARQRLQAYDIIIANALAVTISIKDHRFVDKHNPKQTSILAMIDAFLQLSIVPDVCLIDFELPIFPNFAGETKALVKGDTKAVHIASAAIIAKVVRDKIMINYDDQFPEYGFYKHKGYYTKWHQQALEQYGITNIHRYSCAPVKAQLKKTY